MNRVLAAVITAILVATACGLLSREKGKPYTEGSETMGELGFGISLTANRATCARGDTISLKLKVFNYTDENVTFHFSNVQRYNFTIENGKEVWRWSDGRTFAQVLGEEALEAV